MSPVTTLVDGNDCGGWFEIFMDCFVIGKALIITYYSTMGIIWWYKRKFNSFPVICTLIVSIAIVSRIFSRCLTFDFRFCLK